jgi:SOS-response transcriptional repressor LexA
MISTRLRVKELLRERRWTTKVLAEKTGLSESYLTHIKNGTRRWNEDALKKLAEAFELDPIQIFEHAKNISSEQTIPTTTLAPVPPADILSQAKNLNLKLKLVPVMGEIPSQPSEHNNQATQIATGFKDQFVPFLGDVDDNAMFCLQLQDNQSAPNFVKGDYLIICPSMWTNSGDIVAVEYGTDEVTRAIMQVNFMEDFIVLESVNHKKSPMALVRGKDQFRIIGKVIYRYQKMA